MCRGGKYDYNKFKPHYFGFRFILCPIDALSKQKRAMRHGKRKPLKLNVRRSADCLIDLNEYLDAFLRAQTSDRIGEAELNEILLTIMSNGQSIQVYVQVFIVKILLQEKLSICLNECKLQKQFIRVF